MDQAVSFAASTFRKVLKGFEIGGLQYNEVQFHLQRLLAAGTPTQELREVLRRCERITPLPEYAHADVLRLLDEAREQETLAEQQAAVLEPLGDPDAAPEVPADPVALRAALEHEQVKTQDLGAALAERIASEQAARARAEEARRDSEESQSLLHSARQSLAARDAVISQMRVALTESNGRFAALQTRHTDAANGSQLAGELQHSLAQVQALGAELSTLRAALDSEQRQRQELEKSLAHTATLHQAALESQSRRAAQLSTELIALRRQLETESAAHAAKLKSAEAELQSGRRRNDSLGADLKAAQRDLGVQAAERDELRSQIKTLTLKLKDSNALSDKLQQSVRSSAREVAQLKGSAKRRESPGPLERIFANPPLPDALAALNPSPSKSAGSGGFSPPKALGGWKPRLDVRVLAAGFAILLLAIISWALAHRGSAPAKAPAVAAVAQPKPGTVLHDCANCPSMTVLPAGRFEQGSSIADKSAPAFEKPLHWVVIAHPLAVSTNPVTVDEFRAFATDTGRDMQGCDTYDGDWRHRADASWQNPGFEQSGSHPVTCASWKDAKAYAAWLSAKTRHRYRLPSASEWEYAARAGSAAVQPWSDASSACNGANVADQSAARHFPGWAVFGCDDGYVFTSPVGSFKANAFGLNDMLGNVFQWTEDCWHADYSGAPVDGSARTDGDCSEHELRGGSWFTLPAYVRANYRNHFGADYRTSSAGIRVVRDLTS